MIIGFAFNACPEPEPETGRPTGAPALSGKVSISGTAEVGQTLTANTGSLGGSGTISYQWKRGTVNTGTNSDTYTVQSVDAGFTITVTVSRAGYIGTVTSQAIGPVKNPVNIPVTFIGLTANGGEMQTSTQLTLTFSQVITGLTANDITLSGVLGITKGTLNGPGPAYTLGISGFTAGGNLNVAVAGPAGYDISGSPRSVGISYVIPTGNATVTLTFAQIADIPDISGPNISRSASPPQATITLADPGQYGEIKWYITGTNITGTGSPIVVNLTAYPVINILGQHFLTVEVTKAGKPYSKTIVFTVGP